MAGAVGMNENPQSSSRRDLVFRVFLSSTFSDMKAEREALQSDVFPVLRRYCEQRGARFQAVDLRWGVAEDATYDQRTMKICLDEVALCQNVSPRPNFIILLGQRYGWVPVPAEIDAAEYEIIRANVSNRVDVGLLDEWYRLDENAVPAEYVLRPRKDTYCDEKVWRSVESRLRLILQIASGRAIGIDRHRSAKYFESATHQEINKGALDGKLDAEQHVLAFFRNIEGAPDDGSAIEYIDTDQSQIEHLRGQVRQRLGDERCFNYTLQWMNEEPSGSLKEFCYQVQKELKRTIDVELKNFRLKKPFLMREQAHREFGMNNCRYFTGRDDVLGRMKAYLGSEVFMPLVIHGPSGSGKTALMAEAWKTLVDTDTSIARFVGATPESADLRSLLQDLCEQLGMTDIPTDIYDLVSTFRNHLMGDGEDHTLPSTAIFLDALDQMNESDYARSLNWLPNTLALGFRVIISVRDDGPEQGCLNAAAQKWPDMLLPIGRLAQVEGSMILKAWLRDAGRTLQAHQLKKILGKFGKDGSPLFLKLAFEQVRTWRSWQKDDSIASSIHGVLEDLFVRLEREHGHAIVKTVLTHIALSRHGLTEGELMDVLSRDRRVMDEFTSRSPTERNKSEEQQLCTLPLVMWSRLHADLEGYIKRCRADDAIVLTFNHRQIFESIRKHTRFISNDAERQSVHEHLAGYFDSLGYWNEKEDLLSIPIERNPQAVQIVNIRKVVELPYHCIEAVRLGDPAGYGHARIVDLSLDFNFLQAKCDAGLTDALLEDYRSFLTVLPETESRMEKDSIQLLYQALRLSSHVVRKDPSLLLGQLYGRLFDEKNIVIRNMLKAARRSGSMTLLPLDTCLHGADSSSLIKTIHTGLITQSVALISDMSRVISASIRELKLWDLEVGEEVLKLATSVKWISAIAVFPGAKRVAVACGDIQIRDVSSGVKLLSIDVARYTCGGMVDSLIITPSAKYILGAASGMPNMPQSSRDSSFYMWDARNGKGVLKYSGHSAPVYSLVVTPDERRALSGSADTTIKIWDLNTGHEIGCLKGHNDVVTSLTLFGGGQFLLSSADEEIKIWDLATGKENRSFAMPKLDVPVRCITILPNERYFICCRGKNLELWDIDKERVIGRYKGHSEWIRDVATDGKKIVSCSDDRTMKVWNIGESGCEPFKHKRHSKAVSSIAVFPSGNRIVSSSSDKTMIIWDLIKGKAGKLNGFSRGGNEIVAVTPNGEEILSSSWAIPESILKWNVKTGEVVDIFEGQTCGIGRHELDGRGVCVSSDCKTIVSAGLSHSIAIWDYTTGEIIKRITGLAENVLSLVITTDNKRLISSSWEPEIQIWDIETGCRISSLKGHDEFVSSLALVPDGSRLISGSGDKTLKEWDLHTGDILRTFEGHTDKINSVAVSSDGMLAVSGGDAGYIHVWDISNKDGHEVLCSFCVDSEVVCCDFALDGTMIVVGDKLGNVCFLRLLQKQKGHHRCDRISFSHDRIQNRPIVNPIKNIAIATSYYEMCFRTAKMRYHYEPSIQNTCEFAMSHWRLLAVSSREKRIDIATKGLALLLRLEGQGNLDAEDLRWIPLFENRAEGREKGLVQGTSFRDRCRGLGVVALTLLGLAGGIGYWSVKSMALVPWWPDQFCFFCSSCIKCNRSA